MKYVVTRTSDWMGENPRCPNAQKEMVSQNGKLVEAYTIEINSVEELDNLIKKVKHPIIVSQGSYIWEFELPEIEIYDDYRE